jgi:hypothetical protein
MFHLSCSGFRVFNQSAPHDSSKPRHIAKSSKIATERAPIVTILRKVDDEFRGDFDANEMLLAQPRIVFVIGMPRRLTTARSSTLTSVEEGQSCLQRDVPRYCEECDAAFCIGSSSAWHQSAILRRTSRISSVGARPANSKQRSLNRGGASSDEVGASTSTGGAC